MIVSGNGSTSSFVVPLTTGMMVDSNHTEEMLQTYNLKRLYSMDKVYYPGKDALVVGKHECYDFDKGEYIGGKGMPGGDKSTGGAGNGYGGGAYSSWLADRQNYRLYYTLPNWYKYGETTSATSDNEWYLNMFNPMCDLCFQTNYRVEGGKRYSIHTRNAGYILCYKDSSYNELETGVYENNIHGHESDTNIRSIISQYSSYWNIVLNKTNSAPDARTLVYTGTAKYAGGSPTYYLRVYVSCDDTSVTPTDYPNKFDYNDYLTYCGGGGYWSFNFTAYSPYATKTLINPDNKSYTTINDKLEEFTLSSKNDIPGYYGGTLLFSGNNLDSHFNADEKKYFFIGFKGIGSSGTWQSESETYNYRIKTYKFNSEHFKKLRTNVYVFEDTKIAPVNNFLQRNTSVSVQNQKHQVIGPFFLKLTGYSYQYNKGDNPPDKQYWNMTESNNLDIPDVVTTMHYVTTDEPDSYVITKPAGSIEYGDEGYGLTFGRTNTFDYWRINLPYSITTGHALYFHSNLTEITILGTCMSAVTGIWPQDNSEFPNLTAIKGTWENCTNYKQLAFYKVKKLVSLPDSWIGLEACNQAWSGFYGCEALTGIPNSWEGLNNLTGAAYMFYNGKSIKSLPSTWEGLDSLVYSYNMFENCTNIQTINSWIGLSAVVAANSMFANCTKLTTIPSDWSPLKVIADLHSCFAGCSQLTTIPNWDNISTTLTNVSGMFAGCYHLISLPNSWEGLSGVKYAGQMFSNCSDLKTIPTDISALDSNQLCDFQEMFNGCSKLTTDITPICQYINGLGQGSQGRARGMFRGCTSVPNYSTLTATYGYLF